MAAVGVYRGLDVGHAADRVPQTDLLGVALVAYGLCGVIHHIEVVLPALLGARVSVGLQLLNGVLHIVAVLHELLEEVAWPFDLNQIPGLGRTGVDTDFHQSTELIELDWTETRP